MLLIIAFTLANALIILLLLGTFFFVWFLATRAAITVNPGTGWGAEPKQYISFELDQDRLIAPGSTLTVFDVTLLAVNHEPAAPNQVRVALNGLRLCVCLPLAQCFNLPTNFMGQIAQNRCYMKCRLI